MPENTHNSARAFQELVRVLEEAVRAGVDSVGLEYKGRDLMVFHQAGPLGLGAGRIPQELQQDVVAEHPGIMLLAAAKADQRAWESSGKGHGLLTKAILEGIGGEVPNEDPVISLGDLTRYLSMR